MVLYAYSTGRRFLEAAGGGPFGRLRDLAPLMFLLPLLHWRGQGARRLPGAAVPLGRIEHELLRAGCGAAWAAAALAAAIAVHGAQVAALYPDFPGSLGGYPYWYPFSLLAAGVALYLAGSTVLLAFERPARALVLLFVLGSMVAASLPPGAWKRLTVLAVPREEIRSVGVLEGLGGPALWLAVACAALYAAARVGARVCAPARPTGLADARPLLGRGRRPAFDHAAGGRGLLRRPPSAATAAWRHVALLSDRMALPMLLALLLAWSAARREIEAAGTQPLFSAALGQSGVLFLAALFWPVLVWLDRDEPQREHGEALPVGTLRNRVLHAAAGAAWLLVGVLVVAAGWVGGALAAGTLASPADVSPWVWLGVPCGALTLYLFGTFTTVLSEHPVVIGFLATAVLTGFSSSERSWSPRWVLAPFGFADPHSWRPAAAAWWLALCAAAALGALALTVRADRYGRLLPLSGARRRPHARRRPLPGRSVA
jgi:hypothetical protein